MNLYHSRNKFKKNYEWISVSEPLKNSQYALIFPNKLFVPSESLILVQEQTFNLSFDESIEKSILKLHPKV